MAMDMRIGYLVVCVRMGMRTRMYERDRVPAYTAFRMRNFYGVMPMQMHRGGRSTMICMRACADSVADTRIHMRICIHRICIHRYEKAETGFPGRSNRYGCPCAYVYLDARVRTCRCGCRDVNLISTLSIYFIVSKPHATFNRTTCKLAEADVHMRM